MNNYNEHISTTRQRLKEYNFFKKSVENMNQSIAALKDYLNNGTAAPIAQYGDDTHGGGSELNAVELAAEKRRECHNELYDTILNRDLLQLKIDEIDRAIASLDDEEREIITEHYFENDSWEHIGHKRNYSEQWARKKGSKALKQVAFMLFGIKARPSEQIKFVFAQ